LKAGEPEEEEEKVEEKNAEMQPKARNV